MCTCALATLWASKRGNLNGSWRQNQKGGKLGNPNEHLRSHHKAKKLHFKTCSSIESCSVLNKNSNNQIHLARTIILNWSDEISSGHVFMRCLWVELKWKVIWMHLCQVDGLGTLFKVGSEKLWSANGWQLSLESFAPVDQKAYMPLRRNLFCLSSKFFFENSFKNVDWFRYSVTCLKG